MSPLLITIKQNPLHFSSRGPSIICDFLSPSSSSSRSSTKSWPNKAGFASSSPHRTPLQSPHNSVQTAIAFLRVGSSSIFPFLPTHILTPPRRASLLHPAPAAPCVPTGVWPYIFKTTIMCLCAFCCQTRPDCCCCCCMEPAFCFVTSRPTFLLRCSVVSSSACLRGSSQLIS